MAPIPDFRQWNDESARWLAQALDRLNWLYRDLDEALGYGASRGAYTFQVCERGRVPSREYRRRLVRWWSRRPQPKPPAELLEQIRLVAVPWLRQREGQPVARRYSRRRANVARKRLGR